MTDQAKPTIHEALSAVMAEVQAVGKGDRNTAQGYQFRGIDAVVNAVGPVLRKHGVIAVPHQTEARYRDVQTSNGKASRECTVNVTYRFYGPAGDFIDANVPGESMDFGDKGAPKAMSVAYRIVLLQALCIPTDEPDPDSQSFDRGAAAQRFQPSQVATTLMDAVKNCPAANELDNVRASIVDAHKAGEISDTESQVLAEQWKNRKAALSGGES